MKSAPLHFHALGRVLAQLLPATRMFWFAMLLCHAPALVRRTGDLLFASSSAADVAAWFGLLASSVLFVLKMIDHRLLRWQLDRRSLGALVLVIALMHANAWRFADRTLHDAAPPATLALGMVMATLIPARRWLRCAAHAFAQATHAGSRRHAARWGRSVDRLRIAAGQRQILLCLPPRAPPI